MLNIRIMRLVLENFKCHNRIELAPAGANMTIYGDNAAGKTSIYDAFVWLLFGKDSAGNCGNNMGIKPLGKDGEILDHNAITSVEAELEAGGQTITLRRTYREVWSTKRGSTEETYDGNTSEYYVDGVPCKKYVFDARIAELLPEETFRALTSVSYFAKDLPWQQRRNILFDMAGTMTDDQILATDERFVPLLESKGNLSLDDYRQKLLSQRKGFEKAKTDIPARISENQKKMDDLQCLDFDGARKEADALELRQRSVSAQILAIEHDSATEDKRLQIRETQLELDKLEAENKAYLARQMTGVPDIAKLKLDQAALQRRMENVRTLQESQRRSLESYEAQIEDARQRWIQINAEAFSGGSCPTCGQTLPAKQLAAATDRFEAEKQKRLAEVERTANTVKNLRGDVQERIQSEERDIENLEAQIADIENQILFSEQCTVQPKDMEGFAEQAASVRERIKVLSDQLQELSQNAFAAKEKLRQELADVGAMLRKKMEICAKEAVLHDTRKRIEELRQDAQESARCLEAINKMLFLMEEYTRYKTQFVEGGINSLFRIARFRLFRQQANGGVEDRCDVVYEGVPYIGLNSGMKINVGIDIINTLAKHYGVSVPLFVDNAESVTRLEDAQTQVIRLVVSENDKVLRCEYEN